MRGLMMDTPLLITSLIKHAAHNHATTEIVSRTVEGPIHRYTYNAAYARIQKLANALLRLGVRPGDRIATFAWNGYRHLELYFAISGIGAVCHTVNPRLFRDQLEYIVNHAGDRFVFLDLTFVDMLEALAPKIAGVEGFIVMTDEAHMPETRLPGARCYEELIAKETGTFAWPELDERTASSLCYSSGTTGHPKGALYSHRSTVLHTFAVAAAEVFGYASRDVVMPAVPMFHVNAWGIPYACAMAGAKLVLPGPRYDGEAIFALLDGEKVTKTAGVPTLWMMLLDHLKTTGQVLRHLEEAAIGGSAVPRSMIDAFQNEHGVLVNHAWGMTELSPVGTTGRLKPAIAALPPEERIGYQEAQGRPLFGVEMKVVDPLGRELPRDGASFGELLVRGPWAMSAYYEDAAGTQAAFDGEGWFRTGDIATLDADGHMRIVDRLKDVIKSGGEWISSIDIENAAVGHPGVAEAAVIGIAHPKWGERPLLVAVAAEGASPTPDDVIDFLAKRMASWWLPDDVVFVDALPHTATGKLSKKDLREQFKDYKLG